MIKFEVYESEAGTLEEIEVEASEVQTRIDLIKNYGYMDADGSEYVFDYAQVQYRNEIVVYVTPKGA